MNKPSAVSLGDMTDEAKRHVDNGRFESIDEVVRASLEALAREEEAFDAMLREKIDEALNDPRPPMPIEEAFAELRRRAAERRR